MSSQQTGQLALLPATIIFADLFLAVSECSAVDVLTVIAVAVLTTLTLGAALAPCTVAEGFRECVLLLLLLLVVHFTGGNLTESQDGHNIKSPCVNLTVLLLIIIGHSPSGKPSQRGMLR